jgi:hypothetical protein
MGNFMPVFVFEDGSPTTELEQCALGSSGCCPIEPNRHRDSSHFGRSAIPERVVSAGRHRAIRHRVLIEIRAISQH